MRHFEAGQTVEVDGIRLAEESPFDVSPLTLQRAARLRAKSSGVPAAVDMLYGQGRITVLATPFGVGVKEAAGAGATLTEEVRNGVDKPLIKPYPLLKHVRRILDEAFRSQRLFEVGEGLSLITCRKGSGEYMLGVSNNTWRQQPLKIVPHCGRIELLRELPLDQSEKTAVGYLPEGLENALLGASDQGNIAGGDVRIFAVRVREENVVEISHMAPPARPKGRALPLRDARSIEEEVLARPTFFEHFDSAVDDWRYLREREKEELEREGRWIGLQGLKLFIDLTSGINLYLDLRLVDNLREDYLASLAAIDDVIGKMEILRAHDLILSLHRYPENNFTRVQTWQSFETTLRRLCEGARRRKVAAHLRLSLGKPPEDLKKAVEFVERVGAPNLRLAPSTTFLLAKKTDLPEATSLLKDKVGLWLLDSSQSDIVERMWNENGLVRGCRDKKSLAKLLAIAPEAPLVLDVVYKNHDDEYLDVKFLQEMLAMQSG